VLQRSYKAKVELRQVGPRDVAKLIGGMGACGIPRCCSTHLTDFSPISIKMAKAQGISLNPSEITGMCGRLRCCLMYEYDQYVEAIKTLPKRKKKVITPMGEGRVVQILPLRQTVIVDIPEIGPRQFTKEELDRAERVANGEKLEPLPVEEEPKTDVVVSRAEDQTVERKHTRSSKDRDTRPSGSRRGRGRRSRRSDNRDKKP